MKNWHVELVPFILKKRLKTVQSVIASILAIYYSCYSEEENEWIMFGEIFNKLGKNNKALAE